MGFNIFKWILKPRENESAGSKVNISDFLDKENEAYVSGLEMYLLRMAFWSIVRKIGAAVAAVEWETFRRGKKVKAKEYWSWNHEPNPNQTRSEFFRQLIAELFQHQEAVVVESRHGRYVADYFSVTEHLSGDVYENIVSRGEQIPGVFHVSDVVRITLEGDRVSGILSGIAASEGKLLTSATRNYIRKNGIHGILNVSEIAEGSPDFEKIYEDLINEKFKRYFTAENAVLPLYEGYEFDEGNQGSEATKADIVGTRDIRNMLDDIVELTAQTMGVPVSIVTGKNITDADFKTFMTFTVQPIVSMISQEINRKIYGQQLVYAGSYITPNYAAVKYSDLFDVANPIDKLIGSGAFCINDIRQRLGLDVIDEPWARQHWMTKNYSSVEDLLEPAEPDQAKAPREPPADEEGEDK